MPTERHAPAKTLNQLLMERSSELGEKLAYRFLLEGEVDGAQETRSYQQIALRARAIGALLQAEGKPRERVVLLYAPGIDYVEGFFGAQQGGLIPVPAYPPDPSRLERSLPRLQAILADCQPSFVFTPRALLELAEGFFALSDELRKPRWIATDEVPTEQAARWQDPNLSERDLAFLQYTSGSTGEAKGVMVTHRNVLSNLEILQGNSPAEPPAILVSWLPPYHDLGLMALLFPIYAGGECTFFSPLDFLARPARWVEAISRFRGTASGGPNFAYDLCARKTSETRGLDLSSWVVAFNGAEPIRPETTERFGETFRGCGFDPKAQCPGYGLAESTLLVSAVPFGDGVQAPSFDPEALQRGFATQKEGGRRIVSCGPIRPGLRALIIDPTSRQALPEGQIGELWIAGESVAEGYWQKPTLNKEVFGAHLDTGEGPFLRSGDLGFFHHGDLFLSGRRKDLLIIRGKNHFPQDLEQSVERAHKAIRPGCVAAFSIERGAEEIGIVAEVDPRKISISEEVFWALRHAIAAEHGVQLSAAWLILPGNLPKTSSGKIQRHAAQRASQDGTLEVLYSWEASQPQALSTTPEAQPLLTPREEELQRFLRSWLENALQLPAGSLRADAPLSQYGLDSVLAVELRLALEQKLGRTLSNSIAWSYPTLQALVEHLSQPPVSLQHIESKLQLHPTIEGQAYPLSFTEQGLYRLMERCPRQEPYNLFLPLRSTEALDHAILEESLRALIQRQENLRAAFSEDGGVPTRRASNGLTFSLPTHDLSGLSETARDAEVERICHEVRHLRFDLQTPPLFTARLLRLSSQEDLLLILINHILTDAWGLGVLGRELSTIYKALRSKQPIDLPPLPLGPASYAAATNELFSELLSRGKEAYPPYPGADYRFPYDRPLPEAPSIEGNRYAVWVDEALKERLIRAGQEGGFSLSSAFLVAFQIALHRLSQRARVLFSVVQGNRQLAPLRGLLGYFVFAELFHGELRQGTTYRELLQEGLRFILEERLAEQPRVFLTQPPQMRIIFNYHNTPELAQPEVAPLFVPALALHRATYLWDIHDLLMQFIPSPGGIYCQAAYRREVIDASTIERLCELLLQSLEEIATDARQAVRLTTA